MELKVVARGDDGVFENVMRTCRRMAGIARFEFSSIGLYVEAQKSAMPPGSQRPDYGSHWIEVLLRPASFESFQCDREIVVDVNLQNFYETLMSADEGDTITIKADDEDGGILEMWFENRAEKMFTDITMKRRKADKSRKVHRHHSVMPGAENDAIVRITSLKFAKVCKKLSTIDDKVCISVSEEGCKFSAECGSNSASVLCMNQPEDAEDVAVTVIHRPVTEINVFPLLYLNRFAEAATTLSKEVILNMRAGIGPLLVECVIGPTGYLRFRTWDWPKNWRNDA